MTEANDSKLPIWFWVGLVVLVLWGLMGMYVYYDFVTTTPEKMAKYVTDGVVSQGYADSLTGTPAWATAVFALAVFTGALGALSLVLRKHWATLFYMLSLAFFIISLLDMFVLRKMHAVMGGGQIAMEAVVLLLGIFGFWFSRKSKAKGWLK